MCTREPEKGDLENNIRNYFTCSYYLGYKLHTYFTEEDQIMMFEKLLACDAIFKGEWENGVHDISKHPAYTLDIKTNKVSSSVKKYYRKIHKYIYNKKLTAGAKNLLESYMIEYKQANAEKDTHTNTKEILCGLIKTQRDETKGILEQKVPIEIADLILSFTSKRGGTRRKRAMKRKTKKQLR